MPDIGGRIAEGEADFVGAGGAIRFLAEIDEEAFVSDLDFIKAHLAQLPTRNEIWRAAMLGMLGGAVAAVTLIEALARSWL